MLTRWKKTSTKEIHKNPWWTYRVDNFEIPKKFAGQYYYVHTNGSSMIIPLTDDRKLLLVNQYRYLADRESLEFPCGCVKDGHSYLQTANLELEEETGFRAGKIREIGLYNPYNGVTDEISKVFLATQLEPATAKPDITEEFELVHCTPQEFDEMISQRQIWDGMTLAAWTLAREEILNSLTDRKTRQ